MPRRPDLHAYIPTMLVDVCKMRRDSEMSRLSRDGEIPCDIAICLGSGRCMFPMAGAEGRSCQFCLTYPERRGQTEKMMRETARTFIEGN